MTGTLITGASAGLGRALALHLAEAGEALILVARRGEALAALAGEIRDRSEAAGVNAPEVHLIPLDLTRSDAIPLLEAGLERHQISPDQIHTLICNAGVGHLGPFTRQSPESVEAAMALNVVSLTRLVHWLAPVMADIPVGSAASPGRRSICLIASVAAFTPGPLMAVYYATKSYVLSLGESLREELRPQGVTVTVACPGPFQSEFHRAAGIAGGGGSVAALPTAAATAARILKGMHRGSAVITPGVTVALWALVGPRLPRWLARKLMHWIQKYRS